MLYSFRQFYLPQNSTEAPLNFSKFPDEALDERIIRSLAEDKQGKIWIGTEMGLLCYDANFKKQPLPFPWYETRALLVDRHGAVWVGTSGGGLVRYLDSGASAQFRQVDGLADDFVTALMEDQEGSVWIGTRNGLSQFSEVKIPTFGKTEGLTVMKGVEYGQTHYELEGMKNGKKVEVTFDSEGKRGK